MTMKTRQSLVYICIFGLIFCLLAVHSISAETENYDILIKNTQIVDGTGKLAYKGNVAIKGERIVALGKTKGDAKVVIDGRGLVTCPGFIDPHSHADLTIMNYPLAENLVMQGITTFIGGMCGFSLAPLAETGLAGIEEEGAQEEAANPQWRTFGQYLDTMDKFGISINFVPVVGHGTLRSTVMGNDFRRVATPEEVEEMKKLIAEAMESGAFGFSSGVDYLPSKFGDIDELVPLAEVAGEYGGMYFPHTRFTNYEWPTQDPEEVTSWGRYLGPPENVWVSVYEGAMEAIETGKRANVPTHMAHIGNFFMTPQPHPDYLQEATARATVWAIENAIKEGADFSYDVIAYAYSINAPEKLIAAFYSGQGLMAVKGLSWVHQFPEEEFLQRLETREFRDRLRRVHDTGQLVFGDGIHTKVDPYWMDRFKILRCANKDYEGRVLGEIAREKQVDPLELMFDMMIADPETVWIQHVDLRGTETMNAVFLSHPAAFPSTDTSAFPAKPTEADAGGLSDASNPPPIAYSLFPHYINTFIKKRKIFSLEEGLKKATYLPAQRFGLQDRGILKPGAFADIVVFDFETITDNLDFFNTAKPPSGIEYVLVNGTIVHKDGSHTGEKPGKVLRHTPKTI